MNAAARPGCFAFFCLTRLTSVCFFLPHLLLFLVQRRHLLVNIKTPEIQNDFSQCFFFFLVKRPVQQTLPVDIQTGLFTGRHLSSPSSLLWRLFCVYIWFACVSVTTGQERSDHLIFLEDGCLESKQQAQVIKKNAASEKACMQRHFCVSAQYRLA